MEVIVKIILFEEPYTTFYLSKDDFDLSNREYCKPMGLQEINKENTDFDEKIIKKLKLSTTALFLHPFGRECQESNEYRKNVIQNLHTLSRNSLCGVLQLKLVLKPPEREILDYVWNEKMLRLVWTRVEVENAFSWLSTLGGAYSALGDYFEECAEEAGRISVRQYKLSKIIGDEGLAARSKLYSALSFSQKGKLKLARHIVRNVAEFARETKDKRLLRMCQGVWAKLKYLRAVKNKTFDKGNGDYINGKCTYQQ